MDDVIEMTLAVGAAESAQKPSQLLAAAAGLSQAQVKEAMHKGAVWLVRGKRKNRLRRASKALRAGDVLVLNHNPAILKQAVPEPELVHDAGDYSVWFKPFGMPCQGSRWGDFASIARWVALNLPGMSNGRQRPVHLVHRLDRATTGLILLTHSKNHRQNVQRLVCHWGD